MLELTHAPGEGTLLHGTSRGDGSADVLKSRPGMSYWKWSRNLGAWYVPHSRDKLPNRYAIDATAEALRSAGFEVDVQVDDTVRATADVVADQRDRAGDRAERMHSRAEKHEVASETAWSEFRRIGDMIPMGQPILVGHHSERRHRKDLARQDRALHTTVVEHEAAEYAAHRARLAEREAAGQESRTTVANRVEKYAAKVRSDLRALWGVPHDMRHLPWTVAGKVAAKMLGRGGPVDPDSDRGRELVARIVANTDARSFWAGVLADMPGAEIGPDTVRKGDRVQWQGREWMTVVRVNKKSVTVPSIVGGSCTDTVPWQKITGHRPALESPAPVELDDAV